MPNQIVEPEKALESYYNARFRGLIYGQNQSLHNAFAHFSKQGNEQKTFQVLTALIDYYTQINQIDKAMSFILQAKQIAQKQNNPKRQAIVFMLWANIELDTQSGNFNPISMYKKSLQLAEQSKDVLLPILIKNNLLKAKLILKQSPDLSTLNEYEDLFTDIQSLDFSKYKHEKAQQALKLGFLAMNHENPEIQAKTENYLKLATDINTTSYDEIKIYAYGYRGVFHLKNQNFAAAQLYLTKATFLARQQAKPTTLLYYWYWQLAKLALQQGDSEKAIQYYDLSVKYLRPVRQALVKTFPTTLQLSFRANDEDLLREYADLLLKQAQTLQAEKQQQKLYQALKAIEWMKSIKLQNYFQDECVVDLTKELDFSILSDDKRITAYYPLILQDRIVLLLAYSNKYADNSEVCTQQGVCLIQIVVSNEEINEIIKQTQEKHPAVTEKNLDELLDQYLKMVKSQDSVNIRMTWKYLPITDALYQILIKNIIQKIHGTDILVVIADEKLATIPFAALRAVREGEGLRNHSDELIKDYAIVSPINLSLIAPANKIRLSKQQYFFFAGLSKPPKPHSELPHIKKLYQILQKQGFYGMKEISLLETEFTQDKLANYLDKKPYIIHLATHAKFGKTLSKRFFVAHDKNILINDFEQMLLKQTNKANLLVLSACETAVGSEDAVLGLSGVAVKARVNSVLGSLWQVNSAYTNDLMNNFYEIWLNEQSGQSIALAWQKTQKRYLQNVSSHQHAHPFYWAGFVLIGSW